MMAGTGTCANASTSTVVVVIVSISATPASIDRKRANSDDKSKNEVYRLRTTKPLNESASTMSDRNLVRGARDDEIICE